MMDQAYKLRKLVQHKQGGKLNRDGETAGRGKNARVIAVSSGKGGVGKTNLTVNLAIALAQQGQKVLIIDADLGMANVNLVLGSGARYNLLDLIRGEASLEEILAEGPCGIKFLSGGSGMEELANLTNSDLERILERLASCEAFADIILIDTGAGLSKNVMHFLTAADEVILITTPEPTAMTDAYAIMKACCHYDLSEESLYLVINRVTDRNEGRVVTEKMVKAAERFLHLKLTFLGEIEEDRNLVKAVKMQTPLLLSYPNASAAKGIIAIAASLLHSGAPANVKGLGGFLKKVFSFWK